MSTPLTRHQVEETIEALLIYLDALDGDPDLEEDNEDSCEAADDIGSRSPLTLAHIRYRPGDPADPEYEFLDDPRSPFEDLPSQDPGDHPLHRHHAMRPC